MAVQPGLCRTWSETSKTGFLMTTLLLYFQSVEGEHHEKAVELLKQAEGRLTQKHKVHLKVVVKKLVFRVLTRSEVGQKPL